MIQRYLIQWVFSFLIVLGLQIPLAAQVNIGARNAALGMATTALYENNWGLFSNPASLHADALELGFFGFQNYGFPELTDISANLVAPVPGGASAIGFYRFGDDLYSETNINLAYKYSFNGVHAGASVEYRHLSLSEAYGSGGAVSFTVGLITEITGALNFGAKIRNFNRGSYAFEYNDEELPQDVSIGAFYQLEESALLIFDVIKDVRFPTNYRGGIEIEIVDSLVGRVGATYDPVIYTFGIGYSKIRWQINIAVQQHEVLGTSPGADIILKL